MILLDTHVLLWMLEGTRGKLGDKAYRVVRDREGDLVASAASLYEMALKERKGGLAEGATRRIASTFESRQLPVLDITPNHLLGILETQAEGVNDPFDLLLIAQAKVERLRLLTADSAVIGRKVPGLRLIDGRK